MKAIELYPDYAEAYYNLGLTHFALKEKTKGLQAFRTCLDKGGYNKQCEQALTIYR